MGHVINYVKAIHDVYTYDSEPILNWSGNTFSWAKPIAFNPNIYLKNITDYVPGSTLPTDIDLSGIIARRRGVTIYFEEDTQMPDYFSGYFNGFGNLATGEIFPAGNSNLRTWIAEDGWCGYYTNFRDDYNHWNSGEPPGCLISPMHVLVGGHMIDPLFSANSPNSGSGYDIKSYTDEELGNTDSPFIKLRFIGKNNQIYEKFAVLSFFLNDSTGGPGLNCQNNGTQNGFYDSSYCQDYVDNLNQNFDALGKDLAILELRNANDLNIPEPLTEEELKHIKIYKIANFNTWPNSAPTFQVTPNGVLLIWKRNTTLVQAQSYYSHLTYPLIPVNGYQLLDGVGGKIPTFSSGPIYGDSCNFMYGYYPPTQELVLFGATNTGESYFQYNAIGVPYDIPLLTSLKKWIYERTLAATGTGYNISWIDYSGQNEAIIIQNQPYPLDKIISAGITTASYSGVTGGITYAFALTSYNSSGYSGYAGPIYTRI